jgi:hypothetical protein
MKTNGLTILHQIKAYLYNNPLTKEDPNDYIAKVSSEHSLNVKQISETATAWGGADISAAAMEALAIAVSVGVRLEVVLRLFSEVELNKNNNRPHKGHKTPVALRQAYAFLSD